MTEKTTEIAALEETIRRTLEPRTILVHASDGALAEILLTPASNGGIAVTDPSAIIDKQRARPLRRKGIATAADLDSFVALTLRTCDADSAIFAVTGEAPSFTTIFDYNRAGADSAPRFGEHRLVYTPKLSNEWLAWNARNKQPMGQGEFAEWIDSHIADLVDPPEVPMPGGMIETFVKATGAKLAPRVDVVGVSEEFTLRVDSEIVGARNLNNGATQLSYKETPSGATGKDISVPRAFVIAIPVFEFGPLTPIPARLRFKKAGSEVKWHFELWEPRRVLEGEAAAMIERIAGPVVRAEVANAPMPGTGLPVYRGKPE